MRHHPPSLVELDVTGATPTVLPERLYAALKHRVLTCALLPDQRILEAELARELEVSRTPLREALNRLANEGLLVLAPYRGYAVAPLTRQSIRDLFEVRLINEPEAAALSAERAGPAAIETIRASAELRYTPGDPGSYIEYLRANSAFHLALARASGNSRLEGIIISALDQEQRAEYLVLDAGLPINVEDSSREHWQIYEAVRARDVAAARRVMRYHIERSTSRIVPKFEATAFGRR
jgi:DNA-binding GntR family transcriptional regulator